MIVFDIKSIVICRGNGYYVTYDSYMDMFILNGYGEKRVLFTGACLFGYLNDVVDIFNEVLRHYSLFVNGLGDFVYIFSILMMDKKKRVGLW